jgi:hypothetical protein
MASEDLSDIARWIDRMIEAQWPQEFWNAYVWFRRITRG